MLHEERWQPLDEYSLARLKAYHEGHFPRTWDIAEPYKDSKLVLGTGRARIIELDTTASKWKSLEVHKKIGRILVILDGDKEISMSKASETPITDLGKAGYPYKNLISERPARGPGETRDWPQKSKNKT